MDKKEKYKIVFRPSAEKWLNKLKNQKLKSKILLELDNLEKNPYYGEAKTGDLSGIYCIPVYDISGKYDIGYYLRREFDTIVIVLIGSRENFYKELKRLYK